MAIKTPSQNVSTQQCPVIRGAVSMMCLVWLCGCQGPQLLKGSGKSAPPMPQAQLLCIEHPELQLCHAEVEP